VAIAREFRPELPYGQYGVRGPERRHGCGSSYVVVGMKGKKKKRTSVFGPLGLGGIIIYHVMSPTKLVRQYSWND
jgi:hypothetical protein